MKTNIDKNSADENVQTHMEAIEFLKAHLSHGYVKEAKTRLKEKGLEVSAGMIRQVKMGNTIDWKVLEVLAEIARENLTNKNRVAELINT